MTAGSNPSGLMAVACPDEAAARAVLATLRRLTIAHEIVLEDAIVVARLQDGRVTLRPIADPGAEDATADTLRGDLIGVVLLAPLLGTAVGAAAGEARAAVDPDAEDGFLDELGGRLEPGGSTVIVLVREATDRVVPELARLGVRPVRSALSAGAEQALEAALDVARSVSARR